MALNTKDLQELRENYSKSTLDVSSLLSDPFSQFEKWFVEAQDSQVVEPNAMVLSTVSADAIPSARVVLLKGFSTGGFVFYTNFESDKGRDIAANPNVALTFLWKEVERQVRIQGKATKISDDLATQYFHSRPKGSQIGAWTSHQSEIVADRDVLESKKAKLEEQYKDDPVLPKPPFWGGYIIEPQSFEFWQGRSNRLHDRFRFIKKGVNKWQIDRLSP